VSVAAIQFLPDRAEIGTSKELFDSNFPVYVGNVSADGQRLLLFVRKGESGDGEGAGGRDTNPLTVVTNWQAGLK